MGKPRVLYAISRKDDQPEELRNLFKKEGITLDVITDAEAAIKAIQNKTYDAVISGWTFIGQDKKGIDVIEAAVQKKIRGIFIYTTVTTIDEKDLPGNVKILGEDKINNHGPIINAVKESITEAPSKPRPGFRLLQSLLAHLSSLRP